MNKYAILNFFLILIIAFLVMENYREWTKPSPAAKENILSKQKTAPLPVVPASDTAKKEMPAPASFKSVSDKNIFSPDRKEFPIPLVTEAKKAPPVRPNVQLFGVAVGEGFKSALISNPTRRPNERETMSVREGDRVGEYKVARIVDDRLTLESSGDSFDVLLYDPSKQKRRPVVTPAGSGTATPMPASTPVPPRPYTPPGPTSPAASPPPAVMTPPINPGAVPRPVIRPQRRIPSPPAPTRMIQPVPGSDDDDDGES